MRSVWGLTSCWLGPQKWGLKDKPKDAEQAGVTKDAEKIELEGQAALRP